MTMESSDDVSSDEDVTSPRKIHLQEVPFGDIFLTDERFDKKLVTSLIDIGEDLRSCDTMVDIVTPEYIETLSAWTMTVPNPTYIPHAAKKKHAKSADGGTNSQRPMVSYDSRQNLKFRRTLDLDNYNPNHYKQCVEATTCRYLPNNGNYRHSKAAQHNSSPSMNVRRMKTLDKYISPQQRVVQREVQRSMRKEHELQQEILKEKEESDTAEKTLLQPELSTVETSNEMKSENDIFNTNAEAPSQENEWKPLETKEHIANELPTMDMPLMGTQISEKLIYTFSRRLSILDEEIRRDEKVHRKPTDDVTRSKSEPTRLVPQKVPESHDTLKESYNDMKPVFSKHRRHEPIREHGIAQSNSSNNERLDKCTDHNGKDLTPRKGVLLYKVRNKETENTAEVISSAPNSYSDIYSRDNVTPGSDRGVKVVRHVKPRRTMSFDQNMIQRAKLHRDIRLSSQTHSQYVKNETTSRTNAFVKSVKPKLKDSDVKSSMFDNPSNKHVPNNFTAVPLGKNRPKENEQDSCDQELLPGVSGKRLQMSVVNHRLL